MYFSTVRRKLVTPTDYTSRDQFEDQLIAVEQREGAALHQGLRPGLLSLEKTLTMMFL